MKKEEFIQKIAGYVKKYAAAYEIKVCSPIMHRQFWSPAGENPGWRKTITIILG